jgi:hypothetical protein
MRYLDMFLSLHCAPDVLGVCGPMKESTKEISEALAVTTRMRKWVLKEPMKYKIMDLCAGNALSSVLAVMSLPITWAYAIDKKPRKRDWEKVQRFDYLVKDIYDPTVLDLVNDCTIITSIHPCKNLAMQVIDLYNQSSAPYLILIPCCVQKNAVDRERIPTIIREKFGTQEQWAYILASKIEGSEVNVMQDKYCLSPRNMVITAARKEK